MTKLIAMFAVALVAFGGVLAGALAVTGNLSKEGIGRIFSPQKAEAALESGEGADDIDPIARALREREAELQKREEAVLQKEEQLKLAQKDLERLRSELELQIKQANVALDEEATLKVQRQQEAAKVLEKMKDTEAAKILESKSPDEAVDLFMAMSEKTRSKILGRMEPEKAAALIDAITSGT